MSTESLLQQQSAAVYGKQDDDLVYTSRGTSLHVMQVRAFLTAAEDVEVDRETIDDILNDLYYGNDDAATTSQTGAAGAEDDSGSVLTEDDDDGELDISALYMNELDAEKPPRWTRQEVRYMLIHLKERGMASWIQEYVVKRQISIQDLLLAFGINLCEELRGKRPKTMMYFLKVAMSRELRLRGKLLQYNTISDAIRLIESSKRILILTGAGISVSCGIPDFRSRDGVYAMLKDGDDYQLDDPQQMFDITYFRENPATFFSFASQIYPTNFTPSPCHRFIKLVEDKGKLLRNYTQNIDTLETAAGVRSVLQCHGSFATATCLQCRRRVPGKEIEADILRGRVPLCSVCNTPDTSRPPSNKKGKRKGRRKAADRWDSDEEDDSDPSEFPPGIMKPDITFFGEKLTDEFDHLLDEDRDKVDLLLVIGTSLKVAPVADILSHLPHSIPQILINRTPVRHINPDIVLLGNADDIVQYLCQKLDWVLPPPPPPATMRLYPARGNTKRSSSDTLEFQEPRRVCESHVWLFQGAEGGKWVEEIKQYSARNLSLYRDDSTNCGNNVSADDRLRKKARTS